jgi:hypothetical protein
MGLHLETSGTTLRLWDTATQAWLLTPQERADRAEQEVERLRKLVEELTRKNGPKS